MAKTSTTEVLNARDIRAMVRGLEDRAALLGRQRLHQSKERAKVVAGMKGRASFWRQRMAALGWTM